MLLPTTMRLRLHGAITIIDIERMMEEDGVKCFVVMAAEAPIA